MGQYEWRKKGEVYLGRGINISLRLDNLSEKERQRIQEIIADNQLTEDEIIEIALMKAPLVDGRKGGLVDELTDYIESTRPITPKKIERQVEMQLVSQLRRTKIASPLYRKKLIWLSIVGPSAAVSLAMLLISLF